ncbi:flagellar hook protein FlgE [Solimonas terrae]|uniref:Flagellar hook protein FlgE n=1 Tax=Solimonas terrae TaxID=1396819 RepID=A0A6M2BP70_9GAMM|nr:flagellar hook protein FlgE [Solimonas terrae]NGY04406.1 flagellar hook protein FlgE [Solimonas terrae]
MPFQIALSGLNAASADLNVTANNIANVNTTGFKSSRAEFADLFPISAYGLASNATGIGVRTARVAQQLSQGSVNTTGNTLDLAISGEGYFTLSDNGATVYSRAGAFGTDDHGYVVNAAGQRLQVFPATANGSFDTAQLGDLQLSSTTNPPRASTAISANINLPSTDSAPTTTPFDASDASSYNQTRSLTVYDSLGTAHQAAMYYVKGAAANSWDVHVQVDGSDVGGGTVTYSSSGALLTPAGGDLALNSYTPGNGAAAMNLNLDLGDSTQYGDTFSLNTLTQDGYTTGSLTTVEITAEGVVQARYTNGQATPLGQIALTRFPNPQGLQQLGNSTWGETYVAGQPIRGAGDSPNFGGIQSGALEGSNVDLTAQLVNMITAQRNYQANAQMISTADQITQTIINLR